MSTVLQQLSCDRISAPSISLRLGKSMSTPSSLKLTGLDGCSYSEPTYKCSPKCSFHLVSTWFLLVNSSPFLARHIAHLWFERSISIKASSSGCLVFFFSEQTPLFCPGYFVSILGASGFVLDGSLSGGIFFLVHLCTLLIKPLFICLFSRAASLWCWSLLSGLYLPVFTFFIQV
jgi:hypothetical protein